MLVSSTLLIVTSLAVRRYLQSWCVEVASARCGILHHSNNILKSLQMVWDPSTWDYQSWSLSTILLKLASSFSHCFWQGAEDPEDSLGGENPHLCCQMMGGRQVLKSLQPLGEFLSWRLTWLHSSPPSRSWFILHQFQFVKFSERYVLQMVWSEFWMLKGKNHIIYYLNSCNG